MEIFDEISDRMNDDKNLNLDVYFGSLGSIFGFEEEIAYAQLLWRDARCVIHCPDCHEQRDDCTRPKGSAAVRPDDLFRLDLRRAR